MFTAVLIFIRSHPFNIFLVHTLHSKTSSRKLFEYLFDLVLTFAGRKIVQTCPLTQDRILIELSELRGIYGIFFFAFNQLVLNL